MESSFVFRHEGCLPPGDTPLECGTRSWLARGRLWRVRSCFGTTARAAHARARTRPGRTPAGGRRRGRAATTRFLAAASAAMRTSSGHDSPPAWHASRSQSRQRCCTSPQSSTPVATTFSSSSIRPSAPTGRGSRGTPPRHRLPRRAQHARALAVNSSVTTRASCPCPRRSSPSSSSRRRAEPFPSASTEHSREVIDRAAAVDPERGQRRRPGGGVAAASSTATCTAPVIATATSRARSPAAGRSRCP